VRAPFVFAYEMGNVDQALSSRWLSNDPSFLDELASRSPLAFVHAAREGVDITPSVEERSKLATVRQRDWLVELA